MLLVNCCFYVQLGKEDVENCTFLRLWHDPFATSSHVTQNLMLVSPDQMELRHRMKQISVRVPGSE